MKRALIGWGIFMISFFGAAHASAQIQVDSSGGSSISAGQKTAIKFTTTDGKAMPVNLILDTSTATATSSTGATATATGSTFKTLCTTPCALTIDPGFYQFKIGSSVVDPLVEVNLSGGEKGYQVTPGKPGKFLGGTSLAAMGMLGTIFGAVFLGADVSDNKAAPAVLLVGGVAGMIVGTRMAVKSFGKAKEVTTNTPISLK